MMAGIRAKNTKPEMLIRKSLHKAGFRYRLHTEKLAGKPDLIFPKYRAVIFVNGCFWHRHDCHLFKWPKSRPEFWREKLERNRLNDLKNLEKLVEANWRTLVIWECAIKGKNMVMKTDLIDRTSRWLNSTCVHDEISGI